MMGNCEVLTAWLILLMHIYCTYHEIIFFCLMLKCLIVLWICKACVKIYISLCRNLCIVLYFSKILYRFRTKIFDSLLKWSSLSVIVEWNQEKQLTLKGHAIDLTSKHTNSETLTFNFSVPGIEPKNLNPMRYPGAIESLKKLAKEKFNRIQWMAVKMPKIRITLL